MPHVVQDAGGALPRVTWGYSLLNDRVGEKFQCFKTRTVARVAQSAMQCARSAPSLWNKGSDQVPCIGWMPTAINFAIVR
jgi:hypothetical protein